MVNPFDQTFFRFVLGFAFIMSLSFSVLYFAERYQNHQPLLPAEVSAAFHL